MDQPVRWTVRVSKETDVAVRMFLAQRGTKKGDLATFIEEAVRWRVLDQTVVQTKARNAKVPVADIEAAINEALRTVRAESFAEGRLLGQLGDKTDPSPKRKVAATRRSKRKTSRKARGIRG
jgi:hypothetical protein